MPMWHIYTTEGNYTPEDKQAFATTITDIYETYVKLPRFYVSVVFHDLPKGSLLVGGKPHDRFTRIWIDHFARRVDDEEIFHSWLDIIDKTIAPFVRDRGFDWEIHGDETPQAFWTINGLTPPAAGSEDEARWARDNHPSPLTEPRHG